VDGAISDSDVQAAFDSIFMCQTILDGDVYVGLDSDANRLEHKAAMARLRGIYSNIETLPIEATLSPTMREAYNKLSKDFDIESKASPGGAFLADISQSLDRLRFGPWMPAIARSSTIVSISKSYIFTPGEIDFAMGWPLPPQAKGPSGFGCCVPPEILSSDRRAKQMFAGYGMSLQQVMAWYLFVHSNVMQWADIQGAIPKVILPQRRQEPKEKRAIGPSPWIEFARRSLCEASVRRST